MYDVMDSGSSKKTKGKTVVYPFDSRFVSKGLAAIHLCVQARMLPTVTDASKGMSAIAGSALSLTSSHKYQGQDQVEASSLSYRVQEWMQTPGWRLTGYCTSGHP